MQRNRGRWNREESRQFSSQQKKANTLTDLSRQARALGIEPSFVDVDGVERQADESTLRLLIQMLGGENDGDDAPVVRHDDAIDLGAVNRRSPSRAYQPPFALQGRQSWVVSVQLYSLGNTRNLGHGDFTDLRQLLELVADAGGGGVGVNPLHALNEAQPTDASPYAPSSRLFLNWLYIDVGALPHMTADDIAALQPDGKPDDGLIDYQAVATVKEKILRLAWRRFVERGTQSEQEAFAAFRADQGEELRRYAAFCVLRRREGGSWRSWRRPWARPTSRDIAQLAHDHEDDIGFHEFVQFHAHRQLARCRDLAQARGLDVGLYLDVAVGVDPDGFDAWNDPDAFLRGATIGAPPDALNKSGQNWGLTSFNPRALRRNAYAPFRKMLGASMRFAGAIRLDHVLGLNRIYVIPPGAKPTKGAYVKLPLADLLAVAALESQFHRCLIIGEDLGTVPHGLREALREHGIWTYRVVMFERDERGFLPPQNYPEAALATFSTHDLPTFAGWRTGRDIDLLRTLGLEPSENIEQRRSTLAALAKVLESGDGVSFDAIVRFLNATPSRLIAFALEDLLGSTTQINLPGTHREYPNWRHRLEFDRSTLATALQQLALAFTRRERNIAEGTTTAVMTLPT